MFGLAARPETRAIQATPWGTWQGEGGTDVWAGVNVDTNSAMQHLTVYGCNRFICDAISTLPVDVFRKGTDGTRTESGRPVWLDNPTEDLGWIAWLTQVLSSLLLDGNCYLKILRNSSNLLDINSLTPLDPCKVTVRRDRGRKTYWVAGAQVDAFDILHIPAIMLPGSDVGLSPVEAARQTIGKGIAMEEFGARFFGQGANLSGVIEDPGDVNPEKARMMARTWARLHGGNRKSHLPGVLQGGAVWKPTGVTNEQSQFLEASHFTASQICSFLFMIDPSELGLGGAQGKTITYANLEQRQVHKVQQTFLPWIVRLERALSSLLQSSRYIKFNLEGLLRADSQTRYANYLAASAVNTAAAAIGDKPFILTAEMRAYEDLAPLDASTVPTPPPVPDDPAAAADPNAGA